MLVLTVFTNGGVNRQDIAIQFNMTWAHCQDVALLIETGLNNDSVIYCELEGVN